MERFTAVRNTYIKSPIALRMTRLRQPEPGARHMSHARTARGLLFRKDVWHIEGEASFVFWNAVKGGSLFPFRDGVTTPLSGEERTKGGPEQSEG
jgi:hypothetical protein